MKRALFPKNARVFVYAHIDAPTPKTPFKIREFKSGKGQWAVVSADDWLLLGVKKCAATLARKEFLLNMALAVDWSQYHDLDEDVPLT